MANLAWFFVTNKVFSGFGCEKTGARSGMRGEMPGEFKAIYTPDLPWEERFNEKLGRVLFRKNLHEDPETGTEIRLVRYPKGVINVKHTHPCGHGMYVLEGKLVTHKGTFAPGTFVWFPEGEVMEHGAGPEEDVTVVFITNKAFRIDYL